MTKNKSNVPKDDLNLWVTCVHVVDGNPDEVACHPMKMALCRECCIEMSQETPPGPLFDKNLRMACPKCLLERLDSVPKVYGRELLEVAAYRGHFGHN